MGHNLNEAIAKARDEVVRIEFRAEESIGILKSIIFKNKPSSDDIGKIRKVIKLLEK